MFHVRKFMQQRRFTAKNEEFDCEFCGQRVLPLGKSYRNHCPYCLSSKHIDVFPGDRENPCKGQQKAVGYELSNDKGIVLVFSCLKCKQITRNKSATHDRNQPDEYDAILKLTTGGLRPYTMR
jgi:hypothetical protein